MNTLRLRLLRPLVQGGLALSALLFTTIASADQGTIVLVTGQVVVGEVSQVVTGEYIMVTLPSGEVKAIAWAQIGSFQIGGSATVSTGNPTVAAPPPAADPTPPPTYTPPPPPPPNYGYGYGEPPPPPPPPAPAFVPAWMLGLRLGSLIPTGDVTGNATGVERPMSNYATSGWSIEGNAGMHLTPGFTLYGLWEYGSFGRPSGAAFTDSASLNTVGGGLNVMSNGTGTVGFLFDAALGYRWLSFTQPTVTTDPNTFLTTTTYDKATASGAVLRLGMGLAINATKKFRIDVLGNVTFGTFREFKGAGLEGADPGTHATYGLTAGGRWDL